jgi:hypothetical protein
MSLKLANELLEAKGLKSIKKKKKHIKWLKPIKLCPDNFTKISIITAESISIMVKC